jgi:hypothetical protein
MFVEVIDERPERFAVFIDHSHAPWLLLYSHKAAITFVGILASTVVGAWIYRE